MTPITDAPLTLGEHLARACIALAWLGFAALIGGLVMGAIAYIALISWLFLVVAGATAGAAIAAKTFSVAYRED